MNSIEGGRDGNWQRSAMGIPVERLSSGSKDEAAEDFGLDWGFGGGFDLEEGDLDGVVLVDGESDGAGVSGVFKKELIADREVVEVPAGTRRVEVTMIEKGGLLKVNADVEEVKIARIAGKADLSQAEHLKIEKVDIGELEEDGCMMCPARWKGLIKVGGAREGVEPKRLSASV